MKKNYGEILKQAIKNRGYSQRDIAKVLNVSEMTLSNWTRMPYPPLEAIEMICKYLQEPLSRFFADDDELMLHISRLTPDQQSRLIEFLKSL